MREFLRRMLDGPARGAAQYSGHLGDIYPCCGQVLSGMARSFFPREVFIPWQQDAITT